MKKVKNQKSDIRNNRDYLNFIRRNQQIVEEFKEVNKHEKHKSHSIRGDGTTINDNNNTIQTDLFGGSAQSQKGKIVRLHSKKDFSSLNEIVLLGDAKFKVPQQLPIASRKQTNFKILFPHKNYNNYNFLHPEQKNKLYIQYMKGQLTEELKFPKLSNPTSNNTEIMLEKEKSQQNEDEQGRQKFTPNSVDHKKIHSDSKAKVRNMKFFDTQKTKRGNKLVRTYYDSEQVKQEKGKVSELIPTFKPLQPKKKEKFEILQLNSQFDTQLDLFLETTKAKQFYRKISQNKQAKEKQKVQKEKDKQEFHKNEHQPVKGSHSEVNNRKTTIIKRKKQNTLNIRPGGGQQSMYQQKIKSYKQFIFLVNFAHRVFDPLLLEDNLQKYKPQNKYKYYIGRGNNSLLIKSLMKRRFWWVQVDDPMQANFVWTQLKINNFYQFQKKSTLYQKYDKLDDDFQFDEKTIKKSKSFSKKFQLKDSPQKISGILRGNIPEREKKIFTKADRFHYKEMLNATESPQKLYKIQNRIKYLPENFLSLRQQEYEYCRVHNHFLHNYHIGNKKALFYNLKRYYDLQHKNVFNIIPLTYHIKNGVNDPQYNNFLNEYKRIKGNQVKAEKSKKKKFDHNVWIVKPGELSNRGRGITVIDQIYELNAILKSKQKHENGMQKTYIVQKYIERPLLYKGRKFDIRHFMIMSRLHGRLRAYWFSQGYIRTSSYEYDIQEIGDELVHLTNDAIQKQSSSYGRYEQGNKISYAQFQRYVDSVNPDRKYSFVDQTYPKMRQIAADTIKATYLQMDPHESEHNFEIFGLDFMLDCNFNVYLIQVNTNPCLELSSMLLGRIIPNFMEHTFRLTIDAIFPPTAHYINSIKYLTPDNPLDRLQLELIFDEGRDGKNVQELYQNAQKTDCGHIDQDDEVYENQGKQLQLGGDID